MRTPDRVTGPETQSGASPGSEMKAAPIRGEGAALETKQNFANATQIVAIEQAPVENMRKRGITLFPDQLMVMLARLTGDELKATFTLKYEMHMGGAVGIPDDDKAIAKLIEYQRWPSLKHKLITYGLVDCETPGFVRDRANEEGVKRQRETSKRQRNAATAKWNRAKAGAA